jgi:tRNA(adenine34) deaminase
MIARKIARLRATAVVIHQGKLLGYHGDDPVSGRRYFFLPGGAVEPDESPMSCAVRETLEETGYEILVSKQTEVKAYYDFFWAHEVYACETYFYRGVILNEQPIQVHDASYHRGVFWLDVREIDEALAYSDAIRDVVLKLLNNHQHDGEGKK